MSDVPQKESKMIVKFRVVERANVTLFQAEDYPSCEKFCWAYEGPNELHIEKVWVPRGTAQKVV